jgi:hypothetical protein
MMLQALIAYAERENLGDADFEPVAVRWLIPLDRSGKLASGPIPLLENPDQGRFALGYYHQKADYRRRSAERKEAEAKSEQPTAA